MIITHDDLIDMGRLSLLTPFPHPFPICVGCVPIEMTDNAALLVRKNCGEGGQIVFQTFTTIV
jgi:hypothetical protein